MKGFITKGIGGFYFVATDEGIIRAKGRGIFKKTNDIIYVGDYVDVDPPAPGNDDGVITKIYPRKNSFTRPPISNVDKLIVTMAARDPDPNLEIVDKLLVMAEKNKVTGIVCINKGDLAGEDELKRIYDIYSMIYPCVITSCKANEGIEELKDLIGDGKAAFAGPSGVGKSSLSNLLVPQANMETGEISSKTLRGKHTTRHVEILPLDRGYLYDTPGFTSFDLEGVDENEIGDFFPEIRESSQKCKFSNCFHIEEPSCQVREDVDNGGIPVSRYNSYISCLNEIRSMRKW